MKFTRCPCELWVTEWRKDIDPGIDAITQHHFDEGHAVDNLAQQLFPHGINVDGFGFSAGEKTKKSIKDGATVLFQPTFISKNIQCRADIIVKNEDGWDLYEVKSSNSVKKEYPIDVAFQRLCMEGAGFTVKRTFLVHLNRDYVRKGALDVKELFITEDITQEVLEMIPEVQELIPEAQKVFKWSKVPNFTHLSSCNNPEGCEYLDCYLPEYELDKIDQMIPKLSVDTLKGLLKKGIIHPKQISADMMAGIGDFYHPSQMDNPIININHEAIKESLSRLPYPLYFLDFETSHEALPRYDGYSTYSQIVVQYSLHIIRKPGAKPEHREFLVEEDKESSLEIVKSLRENIGDTGTVISWNSIFEEKRIEAMAQRHPEYAAFLLSLNERMFDLMKIVKQGHYVDSRFQGSASLKKVLPVLAPELNYTDLEIQEGGAASLGWLKLIDPQITKAEKDKLRKDMLEYCKRDTYAMVALWEKFKKNEEVKQR